MNHFYESHVSFFYFEMKKMAYNCDQKDNQIMGFKLAKGGCVWPDSGGAVQ